MIETCTGDLFQSDAEAFVNTVNTKGVMGGGIALQFKQRYPDMYRKYRNACENDEVRVGFMHIVYWGGVPEYIVNFPTKDHYINPSEMSYITTGLEDLVGQVRGLGIKSIAIPPLGCGLGGLDWNIVRPLIVEAFESLPDVRVLLYEPLP